MRSLPDAYYRKDLPLALNATCHRVPKGPKGPMGDPRETKVKVKVVVKVKGPRGVPINGCQ